MRSTVPVCTAITVAVVLALTAFPAAAGLPGDECLGLEGQWPLGPVQAMHSTGARAYVATGAAVTIVDTTVPSAPVVLGTVKFADPVWEISVSGDLLAVADRWDSIRFADVTDPANAVEVGAYHFATGPSAYDVAVAGDFAYVAVRGVGLYVLDISDPSNPQKVGELLYPGVDFIFDVEVDGALAFLAADSSGVYVVDISSPTSPQPLGNFPTLDASDLEVVGTTVYLADGSYGFTMIDVSNPMSPSAAGTVSYFGYSANLDVMGDYAYVASMVGGVRVIRVTGIGAPVEEGLFDEEAFDVVAVGGGYVYASDADPVRTSQARLVNVANPVAPVQTGAITTHSYAKGIAAAGYRAYVADGTAGLVILGLVNPDQPVRRSTLDTPGDARAVGLVGSFAYIADWTDVAVADVSNPVNPVLLAPLGLPGAITYDLAVGGDRVYVANFNGGLRVLDASLPGSPVEEGFWLPPGGGAVTQVAVEGTTAAVMSNTTGWLVDVSDPANPGGAVTFTVAGTAVDVAMDTSHVYVAAGPFGVRIFDRASLAEVAVYAPWPLDAQGVTLDGERAYVSGGTYYGVIVLDISDPTNPDPVAAFDTAGDTKATALVNGRVVAADWDNGVVVLGCSTLFADGFDAGNLSAWTTAVP